MTRRKLEALRALAERPGTEAEGRVAREMLKRAESQPCEANPLGKFAQFMRTGSMDDLAEACGPHLCDCGTKYPAFTKCPNTARHESIRADIPKRFPRGTRVYYNYWAYSANCPGVVVGYPKADTSKGRLWGWIRIKFDHLKQVRAVPIHSAKGWHLSTHPVDAETLRQTGLRGGMEDIESAADFYADSVVDEVMAEC